MRNNYLSISRSESKDAEMSQIGHCCEEEREFRDYVSWLTGWSEVVGEKRIFYNFPHSRLLCSNHSQTQQDEKGGIHLSRR